MPPALSESESDGVEEVIMPRKSKKQETPILENGGEDEQEEDDDEEEGDEDEVTYIVEEIKSHAVDGGVIKYEVKWQHYDDSENTWEPEENLVGATNILDNYFKKIGGRPTPGAKANSAKKRGRKSNASTTQTPEPNAKKSKTGFEGRRGRRPKSEQDDDLQWPVATNSEWEPPKPLKDSWEDLIVAIETIEVEENGIKWAYILWAVEDENGKKRVSKSRLPSLYTAAPQAMLRFYERHLVFTDKNKKPQDEQEGQEGGEGEEA